MAKYKECAHCDGKCPCIGCAEKDAGCNSCYGTVGYAVDTDLLCEPARLYCESGREAALDVQEGGNDETDTV